MFVSIIRIANLALLAALFLTGAAWAAEAPHRLTYQVYAGGVHVIAADLDLSLTNKTYQADLNAQTRGFLGKLVPWRGSFATQGRGNHAHLMPIEHRSVSTWKEKDDTAIYRYDARGAFKSLKLTDDGVDKTPKNIDPALTRQTVDILTATLRMMQNVDAAKACAGKSDVFDSRRRFTLAFAPQGVETLKPSKRSFYTGPAYKCTVEVTPKGGAWKKKPRGWLSIQEQGRKKGTLPTMWVARVQDDLPPVPVRIMMKTDYGTLFMHLSDVR